MNPDTLRTLADAVEQLQTTDADVDTVEVDAAGNFRLVGNANGASGEIDPAGLGGGTIKE